jgi:hypothetical protein
MPTKNTKRTLFMIAALVLGVLACGALQPTSEPPTQKPAEPNTVAPTEAPASSIPDTAVPTEVSQATPAPMGSAVTWNSLEISVLSVVKRDSLHLGEQYYYTPKAGSWLIDVGVLVSNPNAADVSVQWNNVHIQEQNGKAWYPFLAKTKSVDVGTTLDPLTIGLSGKQIDGKETLSFTADTYMRLVFFVAATPSQSILFGISDSPLIEFKVK